MSNEAITLSLVDGSKSFVVNSGRFGRKAQLHAVESVSLDVRRGETLALVGESGSGKSTTARLAANLLQLNSGRVEFHGKDIAKFTKNETQTFRRAVQMVFQDPAGSFNPRRKVLDVLTAPQKLHGIGDSSSRKAKAIALLERVGLSPSDSYVDRYPSALSGGQRQRLALARALALDPEVIIADEPLSALDVSIARQVLELMRQLQRESGVGFLMVTHDLALVRSFADRIAVMYLGEIVEEGSPEQVLTNPQHPYTQGLVRATPVPNPHSRLAKAVVHGEIPSPVNKPSGCRFRTRCPIAMDVCATNSPELLAVGDSHRTACHAVGAPLQTVSL